MQTWCSCTILDLPQPQFEVGNGNPLSILAWGIPWTVETGRRQFMRSQRVRHDWVTEQPRFTSSVRTKEIWVLEQLHHRDHDVQHRSCTEGQRLMGHPGSSHPSLPFSSWNWSWRRGRGPPAGQQQLGHMLSESSSEAGGGHWRGCHLASAVASRMVLEWMGGVTRLPLLDSFI